MFSNTERSDCAHSVNSSESASTAMKDQNLHSNDKWGLLPNLFYRPHHFAIQDDRAVFGAGEDQSSIPRVQARRGSVGQLGQKGNMRE